MATTLGRLTPFMAAIALAGCVKSYVHDAPLAFDAIPYTSVKGDPWPEKDAVLPDINAHYDLSADTKVHYVELNAQGERTLIFVHGLGSYLKFWRYQLDHFAAQGYRVLALDMIGYGKSSKPATFPYTMDAMADVVLAFAREAGADRPVIVGHSMGGQTALSFAIRYPDALSALVLTSPAGFERFSPKEQAWFEKVFTVPLIMGTPEAAIWGTVRRSNFYRWKPEYAWLIEERVRAAKNDTFAQYAYANVRSVHGLAHDDFVRANLRHIKVPTLIVHGDMDRLIPNPFMHGGPTIDVMKHGQRNIPGARLVTLEGCGHTVQMDCSVEYNAAVGAFLEALVRPAERLPVTSSARPMHRSCASQHCD